MAIDDSDRTLDAVEPVDDAVQLIVHALDAPTQHCEIHGISHLRLALPTAEVVWAAIRALPATAAPACALTDSGPAGTARCQRWRVPAADGCAGQHRVGSMTKCDQHALLHD